MLDKQGTLEYLDNAGEKYEYIEHEAAFTIEELDAMDLDPNGEIAKNLFLRNDSGKQHYLIVLRKDKTADMHDIRAKLGSSRLSFASEERLERYFGVKKGSVSPLGALNDAGYHVKIYFDEDLLSRERIGVHPNDNTATVFLPPQRLVELLRAHGSEVGTITI